MLASELISLLQHAVEQHGDKPIITNGSALEDGFCTPRILVDKEHFWLAEAEVVGHYYMAGPWGQPWYHDAEQATPVQFPPPPSSESPS